MKDKDSQLIFETYIKENPDRWPDGSKMDSERARHLDSLRARDEERDAKKSEYIPGYDGPDEQRRIEGEKHDVAMEVKQQHGWDIEWQVSITQQGPREATGDWWRLDAPMGPREITGDERWDIMKIEDPEKYAEYRGRSRVSEDKHMPLGDEHNPGEPDNVDYKAMFSAMDRSKENEDIAMKYEGLGDEELQKHMNVIDYLIDMGEDDRNAYFGGDKGAPW